MPTLQSAGARIHYEVVGHGPPIVLVHGFALSFDANWRETGWVDFLVDAGREVVGIDCRGHGKSDKPHDPAAYSGNQMPDDVVAVMDTLDLQHADIMGYSMGGWIMLNLLLRHGSRFTSAVAGGAGLRSRAFDPVLRAAVAAALETDDPLFERPKPTASPLSLLRTGWRTCSKSGSARACRRNDQRPRPRTRAKHAATCCRPSA